MDEERPVPLTHRPPIRIAANHDYAVYITWRFQDGSYHEYLYTCPRLLSTDARDVAECWKCGQTTLILTTFCGHCGAAFAEDPGPSWTREHRDGDVKPSQRPRKRPPAG
jgi:hypothetical protein